jgi:hypothetical protein
MEGKAMIVAMSRRICAALYAAIVKLRPTWHHDDDDKGLIKVMMTGSAADDAKLQPHIRNKQRREALARRFKNESEPQSACWVLVATPRRRAQLAQRDAVHTSARAAGHGRFFSSREDGAFVPQIARRRDNTPRWTDEAPLVRADMRSVKAR